MNRGRTLTGATAWFEGVGLFSGAPSRVRVSPGSGGIVFQSDGGTVAAHVANITPATGLALPAAAIRNSTVGAGGVRVLTVEHMLSALAGLGIWSAVVEIEGPEVPMLDGSAVAFAAALHMVSRDGNAAQQLRLSRPVRVEDGGGASIEAVPGELSYRYRLDYGTESPIEPQEAAWDGDAAVYVRDIAPARTFSLEAEAKAARHAGLFAHVSPREMVVVGSDGNPIENAWRLKHEPAKHKLLDLIGDLSLLGRPLEATVVATRSGHALAHAFARAVLESV